MNYSRRCCRYNWHIWLLFISIISWGNSGYAVEIPGYPTNLLDYDARELAMLPRYCIYTQDFRGKAPGGNNPVEIDRWYSVLGKAFHGMHHYCWGLMKTNRAIFLVRNQKDREFLLTDAIGEFDFVLRSAPPDFVLLPEIYTKKGENLVRLGRAEGVVELQRAIRIKPDYWPPYAALSDYFKQIKDIPKAREWIEKGLSVVPDAKPLRQRLADLAGGAGQKTDGLPRSGLQVPAEATGARPLPKSKENEPAATH